MPARLYVNVILYNLLSCIQTRRLTPDLAHRTAQSVCAFLFSNIAEKVVRHVLETVLHCTKKIARALGSPTRTRFSSNALA